MGKKYKKPEGPSKRNVNRNLFMELSKKPRTLEKRGGPLEGKITRPPKKEGVFFKSNKNPEEIYKMVIGTVEVKRDHKGEYIEFDIVKVESTDYIHHPEDKRTWGRMRL